MIPYRWNTDIFYFATLTKPTEAIYTLHNLQGQLDGFQSRIAFLNLWRDESFLSFKGVIDQILGPRWDNDSVPHATVRTLKVWNIFSHGYFISGLVGKISRIIFGEIPYATLYNSTPNFWIFLWWMVKEWSISRRVSNGDLLSRYTIRSALSWILLIRLFKPQLWNIQTSGPRGKNTTKKVFR